ncbi:porin family protein [Costertonia aggregata]|uniref:PorT family protein n=1 Tax=Costertonia aggregata TaxID=343403 RepID=A0A7H9AMD0_9FLAO|nr:porin family protein [Costertonia aggregata]QLG44610.1 PorT family protein [Costertonia aggregata]
MKSLFFPFSLLFFLPCIVLAQTGQDSTRYDSEYLEDQFYVGLTYNLLLNKPEGITQRNLSYGLQGGFIKDIPLNARRNVALGIGIGYAVNSYYTNLGATETPNGITYAALADDIDLKRNKVETHLIEMPIAFRWRTSTARVYKFWRIYTGVKLGYVLGSRSKLVTESQKNSFTNSDVRDFQYGLTFNFGYNTFNIHAYYALNDFFNDNTSLDNGNSILAKPLRIGFIFYIL